MPRWFMKCDQCGKFIGATNPVAKEVTESYWSVAQEQFYPEDMYICTKCVEKERAEKERKEANEKSNVG